MGKSYFIKNNLYEYAKKQGKKILFLLHRKNAITQFEQEIKRDKKEDIEAVSSLVVSEKSTSNNPDFFVIKKSSISSELEDSCLSI